MAHPAQRIIDANRKSSGGVVDQVEADRYGLIWRPGRPGAESEREKWDAYQVERAKERERDNLGNRR
jgi:hypothetical protein